MGASAALNVLPVNITRAAIEDSAILTGGENLTISADSEHSVFTTVKAGAAGGTAVSPAVGVAFINDYTISAIGESGNAIDVTGNVKISSSHRGTALTTVDASVAGEKVAVGAAVGVNIILDSNRDNN